MKNHTAPFTEMTAKTTGNYPTTRREIIRMISGLTALAGCASRQAFAASTTAPKDAAGPVEIAPGTYVHRGHYALVNPVNGGDISNATFIVGADAVAVIDTGGSAKTGEALRQAIRAITKKPIRYVINTHMHPDHVFGNAAFEADAPQFVGHHKLARALAARAESYLRRNRELIGDEAFSGSKIVMPTVAVTDTLTLDLGGRNLKLEARPTAHTDNDLTVFDEATSTFILGDLLFVDHTPTLDGSIKGWLNLIPVLKAQKAARAVPGHGPVSMPWPSAIEPMERYLTTVANDVRAMIKAGKTMTDAIATAGQSEKGKWELFEEYNARNVTAAFAELEWE